MRIRIASRAWKGSAAVNSRAEADAQVGVPWIEIDGMRFDNVVGTRVISDVGETIVSIDFVAVAETVLLGRDGQELQ